MRACDGKASPWTGCVTWLPPAPGEGLFASTAERVYVALGVVGAALKGIAWSEPAGPALTASLLQGNIPQDLKFDPARYARTLDTYAHVLPTMQKSAADRLDKLLG